MPPAPWACAKPIAAPTNKEAARSENIAALAWAGFFVMDRYWYHILLKGAVSHAAKIESRYKDEIPEIGLGKSISEVSGNVRLLCIPMNSDRRLTSFYAVGFAILGLLFAALLFAVPKPAQPPQPTTKVGTSSPRTEHDWWRRVQTITAVRLDVAPATSPTELTKGRLALDPGATIRDRRPAHALFSVNAI